MKIFLIIFLVIIICFIIFYRKSPNPHPKANPGIFYQLRNRALHTTVKGLNLAEENLTPNNKILGILMETGYDDYSFTLVALITGDASIYLSNGGGIIGGIGHENVSREVIKMVNLADNYFSHTQQTTEYPLPSEGKTIFYFLTTLGIYKAEAIENDLGKNKHSLSPLFYAGHEVITQLRLIEENKKNK